MAHKTEIEEAYQGEALESLKDALGTLVSLGFFQFLIKANQHRVVDSFQSVEDEELTKQIRAIREENKVYLTLEALYPPQ